MSDNPVRIPPRPPPSTPARTEQRGKADAKSGAQAKKKMEDPNAAQTLSGDSFSRAVTGSGSVSGKMLPGPTASILFSSSPEPAVVGELRQNGQMVVRYEASRARQTQNDFGMPTWGVKAVIRFLPGNEVHERPALDMESRPGRHNVPRPSPITLKIPITATTVSIVFRNWKRGAPDVLDDNAGAGFNFGIQPPQQQMKQET